MDQRTRTGIFLLWVGAFLPIAASVSKTTEEVTAGVGLLEIIKGGGPVAFFFLSTLVAPYKGEKRTPGFVEVFLALFLAIATASTFWSYNPMATAFKCVPLIFAYLCVMRLAKLYSTPAAAVAGVVGVSHILMLSTLVQWIVIPDKAYTADVGDVIPRLGSLYPAISPNLLGVVALVALTGAFMQVGPKITHHPAVALVLGASYAVMLFASRSRIATAVALIIVLIAALVSMHKTQLRAAAGWFIGAAAIFVAFIAALQATIVDDFTEFLVRGQDAHAITSLTGRTVIWDSALAIWSENPAVGYGYYSGHRLFLPTVNPIFRQYSNLDSTWIETLVNLGYLGLVPLALFALAAMIRVARTPLPRPEKIVAVGLVLAVLGLSFVNPTIQTASSTTILFGAIVFACRNSRPRVDKQRNAALPNAYRNMAPRPAPTPGT